MVRSSCTTLFLSPQLSSSPSAAPTRAGEILGCYAGEVRSAIQLEDHLRKHNPTGNPLRAAWLMVRLVFRPFVFSFLTQRRWMIEPVTGAPG